MGLFWSLDLYTFLTTTYAALFEALITPDLDRVQPMRTWSFWRPCDGGPVPDLQYLPLPMLSAIGRSEPPRIFLSGDWLKSFEIRL